MYASKIDAHQARKAAERLGKDFDKVPKEEAKTFAQSFSSGESSSAKSKGKSSHGKATDKPEKANQYCNILNLIGPKNNNQKASTVAAYAKSQWSYFVAFFSTLMIWSSLWSST